MKKDDLIKYYLEDELLNIEKVINDFTPYVYTVITNKKYDITEEDKEEIISDVFLAVWKNQKKLDMNKKMSIYLSGIANNLLSKKMRKRNKIVDISEYENTLSIIKDFEEKIESSEKNKIIISEINKMKDEDKTIFMLYYYNSKSIKEIAKEINITEEKVKSRLFRIRKKLKRLLLKRGYSYNG